MRTPAAPDPPVQAERWARLVEQHEPGHLDAALVELADWNAPALSTAFGELRQLFRQWGDAGRQNRLLLAGAIAHTDIAILAPDRAARLVALDPRERPAVAVQGLDGAHVGSTAMTVHWEVARRLLDLTQPSPSSAQPVRSYYRALGACFIEALMLAEATPHLEHARRLFADDGMILMLSGVVHETFASALYQRLREDVLTRRVDTGRIRAGPEVPRSRPETETIELARAERYLRGASAADPGLLEARVRLARVLGRRKRHHEAAAELRSALSQLREPLLVYYGELFLGEEEQALGRHGPARASFERAAAIYPSAQTPLIALSHLARAQGNATAAQRAVLAIAALPGDPDKRHDPWWQYHREAGRQCGDLLAGVRGFLKTPVPEADQ